MPRRCILKCVSKPGVRFHVFPSLEHKPERFMAWVQAIGGKLDTPEDYEYYRNQRICDRHFSDDCKNRNNRVGALGVPTLHLCEISTQDIEEISHRDSIMSSSVQDISDLGVNEPTTSSISYKAPVIAGIMDHDYCTIMTEPQHQMFHKVDMKQNKQSSLRRYNTYQKEIRQLKKTVNTLRNREDNFKTRLRNANKMTNEIAFNRIVKNMTLPAKIFTNRQFRTTSKKPSGRRFHLEEKVLSLTLYKRSPKCYALLHRYFSLPSPKTLRRLLGEIKLGPGINDIVFDKLKKTVSELAVDDRLCTLIFDEMSITPHINYDVAKDQLKGFSSQGHNIADHALVFMVKGIKKNYKQPVAYYFTNSLNKNELKLLIKQVIENVLKAGLTILCTICDQSTVNVSAINSLVEETKARYLRRNREWRHECFELGNHKIIPLYDVPHLIKGLRNNLLNKDLVYKDNEDGGKIKTVKWEYFQMLYEADKSYGELRCLQKLTEEHVNPDKIKKMRVKAATQIFSHSVAVAAEHLTARQNLPQECRDLIPFVLLIDKLFDSLNGSTFHIPNGKVHKGPLKRSSPHHQLWQKAIKMLKSIKFISKKNALIVTSVPSVKNFVKTIEGMEVLWKILSQKYSFDCILTRNFNQDPVENFFGNIRSFGARNVAPNCVAFEGAFKALLLNNYNSPQSMNANCEEDKNDGLQNLDFFIKEKRYQSNTASELETVLLRENYSNYCNQSNDAGQRTYVCGWVLTKCLKNVVKNCKACRRSLIGNNEDQQNSYIRAKEYEKSKMWLCYPSFQLDKSFQNVQDVVVTHLKQDVPKYDLKKNN